MRIPTIMLATSFTPRVARAYRAPVLQKEIPTPVCSGVLFCHDACSFHYCIRVINHALGRRKLRFLTFSSSLFMVHRLLLAMKRARTQRLFTKAQSS